MSNKQRSTYPESGREKHHRDRCRPATPLPTVIAVQPDASPGQCEEADQTVQSAAALQDTCLPGGPAPQTTDKPQPSPADEEGDSHRDEAAALFIALLPRTSPHSKIRLRIGLS